MNFVQTTPATTSATIITGRKYRRCRSNSETPRSLSSSLIASVTAGSLGTHSPFLAGGQCGAFALDAGQQLVERLAKQRHAGGHDDALRRWHIHLPGDAEVAAQGAGLELVVAGCLRIEVAYRAREFSRVIRELSAIADLGNEYMQNSKPWDQLFSSLEAMTTA